VPTFGSAAAKYIEIHAKTWRNAKHEAQWVSTMAKEAGSLTTVRIDNVDEAAVLEVLRPIWSLKPETASRVRGRLEAVLDFARAEKWRTGENPARWRGHLEHLLPARQKLARGHFVAAPYAELPATFQTLLQNPAIGHQALAFLILTAARSGEVRGAVWGELRLGEGLWTIPAERMKAGRVHEVPLSPQALAILNAIRPRDALSDDLIFKGPRTGKQLSDMTLTKVLRDMGCDWTAHGMRSSFRDWAGDETDFDRDTAEAALAHVVRDQTERAYRRKTALGKRRQMMDAWTKFLSE
jgi:integrase